MNVENPYLRRLGPLLLDVVLVVLFATLGARTHHDSAPTVTDVADVAWPFLVGLGVVHASVRMPWSVRFGLFAWVGTVAIGMVLRQASGDGTAFSFVVVATLFNLATLVGWRLVAALVARRRGPSA